MIDTKQIDELVEKLSQLVPPGVKQAQNEFEGQMKTLLQGFFAKMDMVTREEFDVQTRVLQKTRTMVEELEKKVAELEKSQN